MDYTVTVRWSATLLNGTKPKGYITFTPSAPRIFLSGNLVVGGPTKLPLVNGELSVDLLATDAPGVTPKDFTYQVKIELDKRPPVTFNISLPVSMSETGLDLDDLTPVDPATGNTTPLISRFEFDSLDNKVDSLTLNLQQLSDLGITEDQKQAIKDDVLSSLAFTVDPTVLFENALA